MPRSVYGLTPVEAAKALSAFAGLESVTLEDGPLVAKAVDCVSQRMDFADALHLLKRKRRWQRSTEGLQELPAD